MPPTRTRTSRARAAQRSWSPLDRPAEQVFELETFLDHGQWATVTMRRWTGRESVAFRDLMGQDMIGTGRDGDPKLLLGSMEAALICSLVQSWDGDWPQEIKREPTAAEVKGRRRNPRWSGDENALVVEPLDLRRREHLLALSDPYLYAELVDLAKLVQPDYMGVTGRRSIAAARDDDDEAVEPDEDDDEDLEDLEDDDDDDDDEEEEPADPPTPSRSTRSRTRSTGRAGKAAPPADVVQGEVVQESAPVSLAQRRTSPKAAPSRTRRRP